MKLSISNIAWNNDDEIQILQLLNKYNIEFIEIAPTKLISNPFEGENYKDFNSYSQKNILKFSSIQSACYGVSYNFFRNIEEFDLLSERMEKVLNFAKNINCKNIVFGCPKNRNIESSSLDVKNVASNFFKKLDEIATDRGVVIALEPNPIIYGTNFLNTTEEVYKFILENKYKNIKINLDIGTIIYNNESLDGLSNYLEFVNHVHISEPNLELIVERDLHSKVLHLLKLNNYHGFISIEMKETSVENIEKVLKYTSEIYDKL